MSNTVQETQVSSTRQEGGCGAGITDSPRRRGEKKSVKYKQKSKLKLTGILMYSIAGSQSFGFCLPDI